MTGSVKQKLIRDRSRAARQGGEEGRGKEPGRCGSPQPQPQMGGAAGAAGGSEGPQRPAAEARYEPSPPGRAGTRRRPQGGARRFPVAARAGRSPRLPCRRLAPLSPGAAVRAPPPRTLVSRREMLGWGLPAPAHPHSLLPRASSGPPRWVPLEGWAGPARRPLGCLLIDGPL